MGCGCGPWKTCTGKIYNENWEYCVNCGDRRPKDDEATERTHPLGSAELPCSLPGLPACHRDELKKWVHFAWRELREKNTTIPDDVLDYIRDAALTCDPR